MGLGLLTIAHGEAPPAAIRPRPGDTEHGARDGDERGRGGEEQGEG